MKHLKLVTLAIASGLLIVACAGNDTDDTERIADLERQVDDLQVQPSTTTAVALVSPTSATAFSTTTLAISDDERAWCLRSENRTAILEAGERLRLAGFEVPTEIPGIFGDDPIAEFRERTMSRDLEANLVFWLLGSGDDYEGPTESGMTRSSVIRACKAAYEAR